MRGIREQRGRETPDVMEKETKSMCVCVPAGLCVHANCLCFSDVDTYLWGYVFSSEYGPLLGSPMFSSRVGDSRKDQSVVGDKVLVKSQAGNETRQDVRGGLSHAEVDPGL